MCQKCVRIEQLGEDVKRRFNESKEKVEAAFRAATNAAEETFKSATAQADADLQLAQDIYKRDTAPAREAYEAAIETARRAADVLRIEAWRDLNAAAAARGEPPVFTEEELAPRPTSRELMSGAAESLLRAFGIG